MEMPDRVGHDGFTSLPPAKRGDQREVFSIRKHNLANLTSVRYWPVCPVVSVSIFSPFRLTDQTRLPPLIPVSL